MNYLEKGIVAENMIRFGGGFIKALGFALVKADELNTLRIKNAFPDYWREYLNWGKADEPETGE